MELLNVVKNNFIGLQRSDRLLKRCARTALRDLVKMVMNIGLR